MKMTWVSRIRSPHGGSIQWVDPLTKVTVVGTTLDMLLQRAHEQRFANGIPIGLEFDAMIEEDLCRDYPAECQGGDPRLPKVRSMDFDTVLRGTKVLAAIAWEHAKHLMGFGDSPLVEQTTADYRAMICSKCPRNIDFHRGCTKCQDILQLVTQIKGNRRTPYDSQLKACHVCGCSTEAHVWVRLDLLSKGVDEKMKENFATMNEISGCWKQV